MSLPEKYQHQHRRTWKSILRAHLCSVERRVYRTADRLLPDRIMVRPDPVFVIGSGRCGTSLFHTIMASHPEVIGYSDEASDLFHPLLHPWAQRKLDHPPIVIDPAAFAAKSRETWPDGQENLIREVLRGHHKLRGHRKLWILKSAMLSHSVEVIQSIFPGARFVHLYRHGLPVVESFYRKEYRKEFNSGLNCTEDEFRRTAAHFWNEVMFELDRQKRRLGSDRFFALSYESICAEPDRKLTELAQFLGIDPVRFRYPFKMIENQNPKVGNMNRPEMQPLLEIMHDGLVLMKYLVP